MGQKLVLTSKSLVFPCLWAFITVGKWYQIAKSPLHPPPPRVKKSVEEDHKIDGLCYISVGYIYRDGQNNRPPL